MGKYESVFATTVFWLALLRLKAAGPMVVVVAVVVVGMVMVLQVVIIALNVVRVVKILRLFE